MTEVFYCKSCLKRQPLAGMVIRPTANGQTKKVCASCVIKNKAAYQMLSMPTVFAKRIAEAE